MRISPTQDLRPRGLLDLCMRSQGKQGIVACVGGEADVGFVSLRLSVLQEPSLSAAGGKADIALSLLLDADLRKFGEGGLHEVRCKFPPQYFKL